MKNLDPAWRALIAFWLIGIGFAIGVVSCTPYQPSFEQANGDIQKIRFVRHESGQCFAILRFMTYAGYEGASLAAVEPKLCDR